MERVARNPFDNVSGFAWTGSRTHPGAERDRYIDPDAVEGERMYAMFTHLSSLLMLFTGLPVVWALIMWAIRRKDSPFLDDHGMEAIRFQLSLLIYTLLLVPVGFITLGVGAILGGFGLLALGIVGTVLAAQAAHRGEYFRYPMTLRFF